MSLRFDESVYERLNAELAEKIAATFLRMHPPIVLPVRWPPRPISFGWRGRHEGARLEWWHVTNKAHGCVFVYELELRDRETAADRMAFNLAAAYRPEGLP